MFLEASAVLVLMLTSCSAASRSSQGSPALGSISGWLWHDLCDSGKDGEAPPSSTPAGCICVSIDPSNETNLPLLRPGIWTSPELAQGTIGISVVVREGGNVFDINFGWDYQFKP